MKKILTYLSIVLTIFVSSDAYARIGGFRSHSFRSYSYSRPIRSSHIIKFHSSTKASAKTNTSTVSSKNTAKKQPSTVNDESTTSSTQSPSIFTNAPLWFLVGYASSSDKVNVINNTTETFKCSDCETVKNEQEVYNACMKKCVK